MSRSLSVTDSAQIVSNVVGVVEFLEIDLPTGTLYLTSGNKSYTWGGHTYSPSNTQYGSITNYNEAVDGVPRPMQLTLSGVDSTLIANLVGNDIQFVPITWSIGFIDANNNLLDDPTFSAVMFLGDCSIGLSDKGGNISISAESLLADMQNRVSGCLQTQADQTARFAGDTFYKDIGSLINKQIYWGQYGPGQVGTTGGGFGGGGAGGGIHEIRWTGTEFEIT